jgi:hypothetical protein
MPNGEDKAFGLGVAIDEQTWLDPPGFLSHGSSYDFFCRQTRL